MENKQAKRRATVFEWVKDVHESLGWHEEGIETTMALFDAQIRRHKELYPPEKYQELAAVMMAISAKANGDSVSMRKIAEYTADYMTTDELIKAEMTIFQRIINDMTICVLVPDAAEETKPQRSSG